MISTIFTNLYGTGANDHVDHHEAVNVNKPERLFSILTGTFLFYSGLSNLTKHPFTAMQKAAAGAFLLYRGATGSCPVYTRLGKDSTHTGAVNIREQFIVNKPRAEVYRFWRKLENLPLFMKHLASVEQMSNKHSFWKANLPGELVKLSWHADIIRDEENSVIAWQSARGSMVDNAGKVEFADSYDGTGTELTVVFSYHPPAGSLGAGIANLLNPVFEKWIRDDINNFKNYIESDDYQVVITQTEVISSEPAKPVENSFMENSYSS